MVHVPWFGDVNGTTVWENMHMTDSTEDTVIQAGITLLLIVLIAACFLMLLKDMLVVCLKWTFCCPCKVCWLWYRCAKQRHQYTRFPDNHVDNMERNACF